MAQEKERKEVSMVVDEKLKEATYNSTEKIIARGNAEIAKALGFSVSQDYPESFYNNWVPAFHFDYGREKHSPDGKRFYTEISVKYHSSWDWLIPAYNEISDTYLNDERFKFSKEEEKYFEFIVHTAVSNNSILVMWEHAVIVAKILNENG